MDASARRFRLNGMEIWMNGGRVYRSLSKLSGTLKQNPVESWAV